MKRFRRLFGVVFIFVLAFNAPQVIFGQQSVNRKPPVNKAGQSGPVQPNVPPVPHPGPLPVHCDPQKVHIPAAAQDAKPIITVNAVASGGGQIQHPEASPIHCASPCQSSVGLNTSLVITIHAKNPGGVKNIGVTVTPPEGPAYGIERTAAPDADQCAYPSLSIPGHNGSGGIGATPILFRMNKPAAKATLLVRATNFNGQSVLYAVTYYVKASTPPGPQPPPSATKACVTASFGFTWGSFPAELAGKELPVTVHFHGEFRGSPLPKSTALRSFDARKTYKVLYPSSATWTGMNETFPNLMPGEWMVTAQYISGLGGLKHYDTPITCRGTVPAGTACKVFYFNHDKQTCSNR
ncbi:MAG: hypothetical protein EHM45_04215 [Desulfobacteraceae bacterium]|nr:MAG: hypothetical protein EHM45_04215 [Desulfobacteraceae bacterium]